MSSRLRWAWKIACWIERSARSSCTRGNPPANRIVADSGTTITSSPISRRNRSAAVVFPPPGPPVSTIRSRPLPSPLLPITPPSCDPCA